MCDAVHLQKFRIPPTRLDEPHGINSSMRRVIDQRKKKKEDAEKPSQGRGRGRGAESQGRGAESQGRGRGRGRGQSAASLPGELMLNFSTSNL